MKKKKKIVKKIFSITEFNELGSTFEATSVFHVTVS